MGSTEAGQPTQWDIAFREGYAKGLAQAKGITYRKAWLQAPGITRQNDVGEWVPDIPLPLYGLRKHCTCGRKFWTAASYRGHYALAHILHLA